MFYKLERNDGLLDDLPSKSFKGIHADEHLIACIAPKDDV